MNRKMIQEDLEKYKADAGFKIRFGASKYEWLLRNNATIDGHEIYLKKAKKQRIAELESYPEMELNRARLESYVKGETDYWETIQISIIAKDMAYRNYLKSRLKTIELNPN